MSYFEIYLEPGGKRRHSTQYQTKIAFLYISWSKNELLRDSPGGKRRHGTNIRPRLLSSTSLPSHYSLIILPLDG
jgi:hypothetical protein